MSVGIGMSNFSNQQLSQQQLNQQQNNNSGNVTIVNNYNSGGGRPGGGGHVDAPERNPFLDFLSAPLQATGKKGGNQNDKEYNHYADAARSCQALMG